MAALKEVFVDLVLVHRAHAVRSAAVDLQRGVSHEFGREHGGVGDGYDLIVVSVHDQRWHVELLQVFGLIRFGKRLDAEVASGHSRHQPLQAELLAHTV